jgi:hypothetical protein
MRSSQFTAERQLVAHPVGHPEFFLVRKNSFLHDLSALAAK